MSDNVLHIYTYTANAGITTQSYIIVQAIITIILSLLPIRSSIVFKSSHETNVVPLEQ